MRDFIALFQRKRPAVVQIDRRPPKRQYLLQSQNVEATIAHGQRVLDFMHQQYGKEKAEAVLSGMILDMWPSRRQGLGMGSIVIDVDACSLNAEGGAHKVKVKWGFWRKFLEDEMHIRFDARQRQRFYRALKFVVLKRAGGRQIAELSARGASEELLSWKRRGLEWPEGLWSRSCIVAVLR